MSEEIEKAQEVSKLTKDLIGEVWYGFNFSIILFEATAEERATLRKLVDRARNAREKLEKKNA